MSAKVTAPAVARSKRRFGSEPLVMVTAYDTPFARIIDDAGVDIILVGDSLANAVLGHESTISVGMADMVHHTAAVARARPRALVVADLPWLSYHVSTEDAVRNAAALIHAGAEAVKLEGGRRREAVVRAIVDAEIPVMGHLGLTPQSVNAMGGLRVQAKDEKSAEMLEDDARLLEQLGCFAIVLEGVPDVVANTVTNEIGIPTIGIGAGPGTDGQVLVMHDILGLNNGPAPKFVRRYVDLSQIAKDAIGQFASDVRGGSYPADAETYHAPAAMKESPRHTSRPTG